MEDIELMDTSILSRNEVIFTLSYYILPLILGSIRSTRRIEAILFYYLLIGIGIQGIITGYAQAFMPDMVASFAQWPAGPFLVELGLANISFGLLGLISCFMGQGWKLATLVGYSIFLLLTGTRHMIEIFQQGITTGNTGAFALVDFLMPLTILTLIFVQRSRNLGKILR